MHVGRTRGSLGGFTLPLCHPDIWDCWGPQSVSNLHFQIQDPALELFYQPGLPEHVAPHCPTHDMLKPECGGKIRRHLGCTSLEVVCTKRIFSCCFKASLNPLCAAEMTKGTKEGDQGSGAMSNSLQSKGMQWHRTGQYNTDQTLSRICNGKRTGQILMWDHPISLQMENCLCTFP